jgi:hypothetical protein
MTKDLIVILTALSLVIFGIFVMPLAGIWSLNTLFGLTIPYTFDTWLAAFLLGAVVSGQGLRFNFKK